MARPVVIGLTGGIASGKSTVAKMFAQLGAVVLDADQIGHEVLNEVEVKILIEKNWGKELIEDGRVSRRLLAKIVFDPETGPSQLAKLEEITHPRIKEKILKRLEHLAGQQTVAVVLDAPLLFEAGWDELCDQLVFVGCDQIVRVDRAKKRGWTEDELRQREQRQLSIETKRESSTDIVDNSSGLDKTLSQIMQLWKSWKLPVPGKTNYS